MKIAVLSDAHDQLANLQRVLIAVQKEGAEHLCFLGDFCAPFTLAALATGFHGIHVTGGLIAFLLVLGRTYLARKFTHEQAVSAIVVSYYWHFVDVVWIGLFATIYLVK